MTRQQRNGIYGAKTTYNVKLYSEKEHLLARNKAYRTTLEYCPETCDDVDKLYITAYVSISKALDLSEDERDKLLDKLMLLNKDTKDQGTRKLRQAFVNYVLEQQVMVTKQTTS